MTPPLRDRASDGGRVSNTEVFFDLVYAFAITQISHTLLHHLSAVGALRTLVLWFAVWLGWQYTCWVTNWFDPDGKRVRATLFGIMALALVMSAALPEAFAGGGLLFAICYSAIQVGRPLTVLALLGHAHPLTRNYQRILGWACLCAGFWVAGGLAGVRARLALWIVAVACEYASPMIGFWLPRLGRSRTTDWTIAGGHLAERCQQFVMVALGESVVVTGATLAESEHIGPAVLLAFVTAFLGSVALWWMYFDTSSEAASDAIRHADDPGRIGALFHYVHVVIVGGIIVAAVGNDLAIAQPREALSAASCWVLIGGPAAYVFGNGLFKAVVYGRFPLSHVIGLIGFAALAALRPRTDQAWLAIGATVILIAVACWETVARRKAA
jgi:low temperature requirement protein LtrA